MRSNKKQGERKVIVNNRLIRTSRKILRSLLPAGLKVNEVIKQTGLTDRTHFFNTKVALIGGKLINQTTRDGRTEIIQLEELGRDLAMLDDCIVRAQECYQILLRVICERFNTAESDLYDREWLKVLRNEPSEKSNQILKELRNKLREKGWDSDDLASYPVLTAKARIFERKTTYAYVIALCSKYALFLLKIGDNEIARSILNRIILDAFDKHFSESITLLRNDPKIKIDTVTNMVARLNHPVREYIKEYAHFDESKDLSGLSSHDIVPKETNKFLVKELGEMVRSLFNIYALRGNAWQLEL